jgi:hypothetical protein
MTANTREADNNGTLGGYLLETIVVVHAQRLRSRLTGSYALVVSNNGKIRKKSWKQ